VFKKPPMLVLLLTPFLTIGCATQTPTPAPDSFCLIDQKIQFDRLDDTLPTIRQVKEHNAAYDAVCGTP